MVHAQLRVVRMLQAAHIGLTSGGDGAALPLLRRVPATAAPTSSRHAPAGLIAGAISQPLRDAPSALSTACGSASRAAHQLQPQQHTAPPALTWSGVTHDVHHPAPQRPERQLNWMRGDLGSATGGGAGTSSSNVRSGHVTRSARVGGSSQRDAAITALVGCLEGDAGAVRLVECARARVRTDADVHGSGGGSSSSSSGSGNSSGVRVTREHIAAAERQQQPLLCTGGLIYSGQDLPGCINGDGTAAEHEPQRQQMVWLAHKLSAHQPPRLRRYHRHCVGVHRLSRGAAACC
eukprot:TRINITY_DN521_c1_g1_i3.p1 TRINITY_DN521_c1_g1~~TRINITY_DN521_c1_g1_i3.p1  ORF type:complete len:292 (-),score=100.06 TRINITY_DN521_c1_g1_i3:87-962(-)